MIKQLISVLSRAKERGLFHIIISSSLVKIVSFISTIFLPRFLSKSDYGLLTYVDNVRNYLMLLNGLGIANATLRYCTKEENDSKKKGYFITCIIIGIIFDVIMIIISIGVYMIVPFQFAGSNKLLLLMSFLPMFMFLFEDLQLFFRACFDNRKYSILSFVYSALMVIVQIVFVIMWGLEGVVVARYLVTIICILLAWRLLSSMKIIKTQALYPSKNEVIVMIKFGMVMLITNATSLVMQLNETFIIGKVLNDQDALAEYRVASYILQISLFVVQALVVFIFPYFVRHMDDKQWVWDKFKKVFKLNAMIMVPLHIVLIISAKFIVLILFGENYLGAVPIMKMLLVASLGQAVFRAIVGNILGGIGEERFNLKINIVFVIAHAIIDVWAIKSFGIAGAAIALTVVYFASGLVMIVHLRNICNKAKRLKEI